MIRSLYFVFIAILLMGCKQRHKTSDNFRSVDLKKDDPMLLALKDSAQAHMNVFIDSLKLHGAEKHHYVFSIKSDFMDKDMHEHMWSRVFNYDDGAFKGVFADSAFRLTNIKFNDRVSVKKSAVEDWLIFDQVSHKTIGEFSVKYLRQEMKEKED